MRRLPPPLGPLLLAVAYAVTAKVGLGLDAVSGFATLVWPPTGIAIAAIARGGLAYWPAVAAGALAANVWNGAPPLAAIGVATGNTLEAIACVAILRRLGNVRGALASLREVLALLVAATLAPVVSAGIGVASLRLAGVVAPGRVDETLGAWWFGDALGAIVVAPPLLAWTGERRRPDRPRAVEAALLGATVVAIAGYVFCRPGPPHAGIVAHAYVVFPALLWAALRFGVRGASAVALAVASLAVVGTSLGRGPFVRATLVQSLLALQLFMAVLASAGLILGAAVHDRLEAMRRRDEILAIVSHDLKNPIGLVRLSADHLARALPPELASGPAGQRIAAILRATDRMTKLVTGLLDLAALDAGRSAMRLAPVEAGALLEEAAALQRPLAAEQSQTLRVAVPRPSPELRCDRDRILQVLANVVGNAVKYAGAGAEIALSCALDGGFARVRVADSGPGMSPDEASRAFEPFWRGAARADGGTGLGLSIARGIVHAHGGEIGVETAPGRGTTVWFTLPIA